MSLTERLRDIERRLSELDAGAKATTASGLIVVEVPRQLSKEQLEAMRATLGQAVEGTGQRVLILDHGMRIARPTDEQIAALQEAVERVEGKLDALLEALDQEEGETAGAATTLDGEQVGGERDQSQSLDG